MDVGSVHQTLNVDGACDGTIGRHGEHASASERNLQACRNTDKVPDFAARSAEEECARPTGFDFSPSATHATFIQAACGTAEQRVEA
jgi:hypothetical protein